MDAINSLKGQEQNKNNFQTLDFKSQKKKKIMVEVLLKSVY